MARKLTTDQARVSTISISFADGDPLSVTYAQGLVTPAFWPTLYSRGSKYVLADLLLDWDLLDDNGQKLQPAPLSNEAHWDSEAREARVGKLITERVEQSGRAKQPVQMPTDEECEALRAEASTAAERRAAYTAAWIETLAAVPNVILLRVHESIIEDIKPGN